MSGPIHREQNRTSIFLLIATLPLVFCNGWGCQDKTQTSSIYKFSSDWVSENMQLWKKYLSRYSGVPNVHYLEIGVFEGRSLIWMLDNILTDPTSKATGIDLFPKKIKGIVDLKERYFANIKASGFEDKVTTIEGTSQIELRKLSPDSFDIIYIDGSHIADDVLTDAVLSWLLLKYDGILIFDDYSLGPDLPVELRPQLAIDAFLTTHRNFLEQIHRGRQVMLRKVKPAFSNNKYYFPIGQYVYSWRLRELFDAQTKKRIKLSDKEKELIEKLIKSRKFGEMGFSPDHDLLEDEQFLNLKKRLALEFADQEDAKSK